MPSRYRGKVKAMLDERMSKVSYSGFILIVVIGMGIGLLMAIPEDIISFSISMTISVTAGLTAFLIFAVPKIILIIKGEKEGKTPYGKELIVGKDEARIKKPRLDKKSKVEPFVLKM